MVGDGRSAAAAYPVKSTGAESPQACDEDILGTVAPSSNEGNSSRGSDWRRFSLESNMLLCMSA